MNDERVAGHRAFDVEGAGEWVAAGGAADAFGVAAASVDGPGFHGIAGVDVERGRYGIGEEMMEFDGFEGVGFGSGAYGRLSASVPFEVDVGPYEARGSFYAVLVQSAVQGDAGVGIEFDCGFDAAVLENALERAVAKIAGELCAVQGELEAFVAVVFEELEVRDPAAFGRTGGLSDGEVGKTDEAEGEEVQQIQWAR